MTTRPALLIAVYSLATVGQAVAAAIGPPSRSWYPQAPPLPRPAGAVIRVADCDGLHAAVRIVKPGGAILLADGVYSIDRTVVIDTDGVTLRGASGRREDVVLDGGG